MEKFRKAAYAICINYSLSPCKLEAFHEASTAKNCVIGNPAGAQLYFNCEVSGRVEENKPQRLSTKCSWEHLPNRM